MNQILYERSIIDPWATGFSILLLACGAFCGALWLVHRRARERWPDWSTGLVEIVTRPGRAAGFLIALGIATATFQAYNAQIIYAARHAENSLQTVAEVVEGVIEHAETSRDRKQENLFESFTVKGREFYYVKGGQNPYPLLIQNGGALDKGKSVRLTLSGNMILKVETTRP